MDVFVMEMELEAAAKLEEKAGAGRTAFRFHMNVQEEGAPCKSSGDMTMHH